MKRYTWSQHCSVRRPHWLSTVSLLAGLATLSACGVASNAATMAAPPASATHVMAVGQSVPITESENLTLERVNDSRCKTGAVCVWAGYVSYSFTLSGKNGSSSFVLSDAMPGGPKEVTQDKLTFALVAAEPAAAPALNGPAPDYRVTVKVSEN